MKKFIIIGFLVALIAGLAIFFAGNTGERYSTDPNDANAYLRVHIRANSNRAEDQEVKYKVRDEVVSYLTPIVAECTTKEEAIEKIGANLDGATRVAEATLKKYGYTYGARASIREEEFPTRIYKDTTLAAGVYDALILELGTGEGDNWWCVVYPPLCFGGGNCKIEYKSKISEIIKKFFS
jgi:stage II sporulation protein R